jgi:hypothetical protein
MEGSQSLLAFISHSGVIGLSSPSPPASCPPLSPPPPSSEAREPVVCRRDNRERSVDIEGMCLLNISVYIYTMFSVKFSLC